VRSRLRSLSEALDRRACATTISRLLRKQGYGLRSHRKVLHTGKPHAERDRQFRYIAAQREGFRRTGDPRISVDAKKKELVGNFKNAGQSWRQEAEEVNAHDFPQDAECRASQYGIYDPERNEGHVCVATSADTPDLAVDAIADWWRLPTRSRCRSGDPRPSRRRPIGRPAGPCRRCSSSPRRPCCSRRRSPRWPRTSCSASPPRCLPRRT